MRSGTICALVLVAALLAPTLTAAQCPVTLCKADFANALGGPVDCCKHDYSKGKCAWGGTPVSWTRVRTCNQEGKNYDVLRSANFQGDPAGSPECRCNSQQAAPPSFSVLQACVQMKPRVDQDVVGNDIPCKSNAFCQICGGLEAVKDACLQNNRCVAFTFESSTGCGYLKSEPYLSARKGWVTFTRD